MRRALLVLLVLFAVPLSAQMPPEMAEAQAKLASGDADAAIRILEPWLAANPTRLGAFNMLAAAYQRKGDFAKALENYNRAAQAPAFSAQAWFGIATVHAQQKNLDEAFRWLAKVRTTGSFDFDVLQSDPRLEEARKDPRWAKLKPSKEDFANPFVEKTRIIHEWVGEAKGSQFGWIARRIGDVDGDRVADVTTSAPTFAVEGQPAGRVYVYSSRSGKLLWTQTGKPGDQLGLGIEAAGDTNGDRIPDVVAGAPGAGRSYVYSGRDGKLLLTLGDGDPAELHGRHTAAAGDVNRDGHDDVLVGAPGKGAGRAYLYSGKSGELLHRYEGEEAGDQFGVAVAGDKGLIVVGAPGAGPRNSGRVYVYEGANAKPKYTFDSDETGGAFGGMFLSVVGDANGDRKPDIYATDWANNALGRSTGRAYLYSGADGKLLRVLTGENAGDGFGIGAGDAGDVDKDGRADLVIGAWQFSKPALSGGKIYVYSGDDGKLIRTITSRLPGETLGFDTTNVGDVDGDGVPDFLLTSAWSGVNGFQSGRMYIISGAAPGKRERAR
jgi:hypothetical protein